MRLMALKSEVDRLCASSWKTNLKSVIGPDQCIVLWTVDASMLLIWLYCVVNNMKYSIQQIVFIYSTFSKHKPLRLCWSKFYRKFSGSVAPSRATVHRTVAKFRTMKSVLDKKKTRERHVLTRETLHNIGAWLEATLRKSLHFLALHCGMSRSTHYISTKLLKLWPLLYVSSTQAVSYLTVSHQLYNLTRGIDAPNPNRLSPTVIYAGGCNCPTVVTFCCHHPAQSCPVYPLRRHCGREPHTPRFGRSLQKHGSGQEGGLHGVAFSPNLLSRGMEGLQIGVPTSTLSQLYTYIIHKWVQH
jgi:hypothetical protein